MAKPTSSTEIKTPLQPASVQQQGAEKAGDLAAALIGPLDSLLAMGEMVQRQPLSDAAEAQVQTMMTLGRRMARLLGDAAALRTPLAPPALEAVSLCEVVEEVDARWRGAGPSSGAPRVLISCDAPVDLRVVTDPARLRRLLTSLIEDGVDAGGPGVIELQLSVRLDAEGGVIVKGRLEAPGAPADALAAPTLSLCRALAEQMDGTLSSGPAGGAGALTTFALRLQRAHEAAGEDDVEADEGPLPPRTHLLIVDDNATNRIVAAALCGMFGCTTETAEDGMEAVEAVQLRSFDLILMDIKMPRMDGLEATRAIRALPGAAASIPIVALTANADAEAAATYMAAGMQAVVDKPIKPDQLLVTLQRVLCKEEAPSALQSAAA